MKTFDEIKKDFVLQLGEYSCGLACMSMIVKYHGGDVNQEQLKSKSGTTVYQGTTLLGLYQVAPTIGLTAEAFEADLENLKLIESPVIIHVIKEKNPHFMVCYGFSDEKFTIADPAWGVLRYSCEEVDSIWQSKALLTLTPSKDFKTVENIDKKKIQWFKTLLTPDIQILGTAAGIGLISAGLGLSMNIFAQKLIDNILPNNNINKLITGLFFLLSLLCIRQLIDYMRMFLLWKQSLNFGSRMTNNFFSKILFLPKYFFDSMKTGEIVQ